MLKCPIMSIANVPIMSICSCWEHQCAHIRGIRGSGGGGGGFQRSINYYAVGRGP